MFPIFCVVLFDCCYRLDDTLLPLHKGYLKMFQMNHFQIIYDFSSNCSHYFDPLGLNCIYCYLALTFLHSSLYSLQTDFDNLKNLNIWIVNVLPKQKKNVIKKKLIKRRRRNAYWNSDKLDRKLAFDHNTGSSSEHKPNACICKKLIFPLMCHSPLMTYDNINFIKSHFNVKKNIFSCSTYILSLMETICCRWTRTLISIIHWTSII